jgi:hypothetical protein
LTRRPTAFDSYGLVVRGSFALVWLQAKQLA